MFVKSTILSLSSIILGVNSYAQDSIRSQIEQVVVTAQLAPTSLQNSVYKVRTITQEQIMRRGTLDMTTLLNTELGIRFSNDMMLGESDIELMGMSGQNVKIMMDGVPLLDRGAGRQSLTQIDLNMIEKIEIIEGPVSVTYGTDALAGVINFITKNQAFGRGTNLSVHLQEETVGSEYKPFHKEGRHNAHIGVTHYLNNWQFNANVSRNNFGGWQGSAMLPQLQWQPKDQWLASGKIGYANAKHQTWYRFDYTNEDLYTPGAFNQNNTVVNKNFISNRYNNMLQSNWKFSDRLTANGSLSFQKYDRSTLTKRTNLVTNETVLTTGSGEQDIVKFNSLFFRGTVQYKFSEQIHTQLGVEYDGESGSGDRLENNASVAEYATFFTAEIQPISRLNIRPGVRFVGNTVFRSLPVIPSLNLKYGITDQMTWRAAYARGFRSPALRELYFQFFDANHSINGNTNLRPENSNSFNSYFSYENRINENKRFYTSLGGTYNVFRDMIEIGFDSDNPSINTYLNIARFKTATMLWENTFHYKGFQAGLGFSYIGRMNMAKETDPSLSEFLWNPEINSNLSYYFAPWGLNTSLFFKYSGRRPRFEFRNETSGTPIATQVFVNAFTMSDITFDKKLSQSLRVNAGVRNLFDVKDLRNTGTVGEGAHGSASSTVPMGNGRSYFIGLQLNMNK